MTQATKEDAMAGRHTEAASRSRAPTRRRGRSVRPGAWPGRVWSSLIRHRRGLLSFLVVLTAWELVARFVVRNSLFLAGPAEVLRAGRELTASGELQQHIATSGTEFLIGFSVASVLGIAIGAVMGLSAPVRAYLDPWVSALYATPLIAIGPLFVLWFGLGVTSKVALVVLTAIFPIIINTYAGLNNTDATYIRVVRSFGASPWQVFTKVRFPSSLPFVVAGERLGVARALVGVVVAELFGARSGLGYLILVSSQTFNTANLFVGVLVLAGSGVIAMALLQRLEYRLSPWRFSQGKEAM